MIIFDHNFSQIGENIIYNIIKPWQYELGQDLVQDIFPAIIAILLDGPDLIKTISLIAFCSVLLSFNASSLSTSVFNAYAQTQSESVTSGESKGGAATAGGISGGVTCTGQCRGITITNAPRLQVEQLQVGML